MLLHQAFIEALVIRDRPAPTFTSPAGLCRAFLTQLNIKAAAFGLLSKSVRSPSSHGRSTGPDYIKQQGMEPPVEIKEVPVETKEKKDSPHFYRKGTTPPHSPVGSPGSSGPPSPHSKKKAHQLANSTGHRSSKEEKASRKPSKEEKPSRKISKDERPSKKSSREERPAPADPPRAPPPAPGPALAPPPPRQEQAPPKPPKAPEPQAPAQAAAPGAPVNGQLHTEYHSYYVKPPTRALPPPEREEDYEEEPIELALARMPPAPKSSGGAAPPRPPSQLGSKGADGKLRKLDSLKPKSLADAKRASMEMADALTEESGPNSILVAMVMLLNIGLAIVFVHFLT
ncbi:unnamed protein product [Boreogadus saida]